MPSVPALFYYFARLLIEKVTKIWQIKFWNNYYYKSTLVLNYSNKFFFNFLDWSSCVENDTNYYGAAAEVINKVTSLKDCQQLCVRNLPCAVACYDPVFLGCWLKVKDSYGASTTGMFCVQKYCPGFGKHIKPKCVITNWIGPFFSKMQFKNNLSF